MKQLVFGIKVLQARLRAALRAVQAGRRVVATPRNRPIAGIVAPQWPVGKMSAMDRRSGHRSVRPRSGRA